MTDIPRAEGCQIYVAGPYAAVLRRDGRALLPEYRRFYDLVASGLEQAGYTVFSPHRNEMWGAQQASPETTTTTDFGAVAASDIVLALYGGPASPGTLIELGWASALGKSIVVLELPGASRPALLAGMTAITPVSWVPVQLSDVPHGAIIEAVRGLLASRRPELAHEDQGRR